MSTPDAITRLLSYDPLADAEDVTGLSYKEDPVTQSLGFGLHLMHAQHKAAALQETHDSWFNMPLAETLDLHADLGFSEVLTVPFVDADDTPETYHVLWHEDGLLATVESYQTTGRNNSKLYYNFEFRGDIEDRFGYTSSGSFHRESYDAGRFVWVGNHDTREGLRSTIERFRTAGDFLSTWVERPFLWLLTYADSKVDGYDYEQINGDRINQLPEHVRAAITPDERPAS